MNKISRGLLAVAVSSVCASAMAQAPLDQYTLQIERRPLIETLRKLSEQTGLQVVAPLDSNDDKNIIVGPLKGEYTVEAALNVLLAQSDLVFSRVNENTIAVKSKDSAKAPRSAPDNREQRQSPMTGLSHEQLGGGVQFLQIGTVQSTGDSGSDSAAQGSGGSDAQALPVDKPTTEEVVVTGSHIRGNVAAGSKLIVIDRQAIEASGYSRVQDILRNLPQNFSNVGEANGADVNNGNRGAEIQLRGLGSGTTLTLVNGQRQAAGGEQGNFVDISSIAASAVERIEILSEGASALYGSDAIGGVVNVILRKDFEGFETSIRGGTTGGDADELLASQLWGGAWSRGRVLVGYQYNERDSLPASAHAYTASNGDFRRFGGTDQRIVGGNPGTIVNASGQVIAAIPSGQDGTALTSQQLISGQANYFDNVTYSSLLPAEKLHSAFISSSYDVTDNWAVSLDGRYSTRDVDFLFPQSPRTVTVPASNAFNPLGSSTRVAYDFTEDLGPIEYAATTDVVSASIGIAGSLPGLWEIKFSAGYAEEKDVYMAYNTLNATALQPYLNSADESIAFNVFGEGANTAPATIAALRSAATKAGRESNYTISSAEFIASGPMFSLPAGTVKLALGGSYREEELDNLSLVTLQPRGNNRGVSAVFTELAVPLWQGTTRASGQPARVELSLAGRYEEYNDFGNTFDPKVGLSWRPWNWVKLRGTWGTSFRAPQLSHMEGYNSGIAVVTSVPDPQSATNSSVVLTVVRPDASLSEETADVWTAGVDFTPSFVDGLSLSFTLFDIAYKDKIANPSRLEMLVNEAQYARYIIRNPSQAQIDVYCVDGVAAGYIQQGNCNQPIAAILDLSATNLSEVNTSGLDTDLNYAVSSSFGEWRFGVRSTYIVDYKQAVTAGLPSLDVLDTYRNPLSLRLGGTIGWQSGAWNAQATINYTGSYKETTAPSARRIDDWTTLNLTVGYEVNRPESWFDNSRVSLGVINVLDEDPPFVNIVTSRNVNSVGGYDTANANILGRQVGLQVVKPW